MALYLVQHGLAKPEAEDPERSLTDAGAAEVECMARWLAGRGVEVREILHSGKRRAEQTAGIFSRHLTAGTVRQVDGLKPGDEVRVIADMLALASDSLMLVGHLPHLANLAGWLVTGSESPQIIRFRNAGVVCLERTESAWQIAWAITPEQAAGNEGTRTG